MSFDGTYNVSIDTPMGKQESVVTLTQAGDDLNGTMAAQGDQIDIKNGKVNGDTATWDADITKPMPMTLSFEAKKEGDGINGSVKLGAFGNASFSGSAA
ncbi:MAG: hypothetical protein AAF603_10450 [Pseudomonadota bacterium]